MGQKDINSKPINLIYDFVESKKDKFPKNKLISLAAVIIFHLSLITLLLISSLWTIHYINEPPTLQNKLTYEIPVWSLGYKAGHQSQHKIDNIKKTVDINPAADLKYEIDPDLIYFAKTQTDNSPEPIDGLDFDDFHETSLLPEKPIDFKVQEPQQNNNKPVWITTGQQPKVLTRIQPDYPELARIARLEGEVILEVVINEEGKIESIKVLNSSNNLFNDAAIKAVTQWRFEPGTINNRPVKAYYLLTIKFKLNSNSNT